MREKHRKSLASERNGQVMILTVLALGGTILGATTIAGLLMMYQIRQTIDIKNSAKAIYAADSGQEWALYQFFHPSAGIAVPTMSNGSTLETTCFHDASQVSCTDDTVNKIKAIGGAGNATRAFELNL